MADKRVETLAWFAEQMGAKLERDRHKGDHWQQVGVPQLFFLLQEELQELAFAIIQRDPAEVAGEAADVANYAMMIADCFRQRR